MDKLWNYLNINKDFNYLEIDNIYRNITNTNKNTYLAWKILRDRFYSKVYKEYESIDMCYKAGFIDDNIDIENIDFYNLQLLTTPYGKLFNNLENNDKQPIVLLSTGGFAPIHDGHIEMMEVAKKKLQEKGYNVIGGYFSPSHDKYVLTKPLMSETYEYRLQKCQEKIQDNNWLMIDPFECKYINTYVNFTDIINRLEQYLQKYVDKRIKVAYVFGSDNLDFMYCFENDGIGVCVERDLNNKNFQLMKNKNKNINNIFINKTKKFYLKSREIRKENDFNLNKLNENTDYIIRNESILPFNYLLNIVDKNTLINTQKIALEKFKNILTKQFPSKNILVMDLNNQLELASKTLKGQKTISLDSYFNGTYNLNISRLFNISDSQLQYNQLTTRNNSDINYQIKQIIEGNYILVDDDSVSGNTIKSIKKLLPKNIEINNTYFFANQNKNNIFDVVDFRDFIIGSENGGLMVKLNRDKNIRVPYILPYVSSISRASINPKNEIDFSIQILELNYFFYKNLKKNIKISDLAVDIKELMCYININDSTNILDAIEWHINILKNIQKFH